MEHCRRVDVDQVPVLVQTDGEITAEDLAAVRQLVRYARRIYAATHPERAAGGLAAIGRHGRTLESVWCCEGQGYGPDGRCLCSCHTPKPATPGLAAAQPQ
jgi:hypothetical protein